jgi:hypothetical protein
MKTQTMNYLTTQKLAEKIRYDARIHYLYPSKYQVRENRGFYIPNLLSDAECIADPEAYSALAQQAKYLHKAEGLLDDAWNLTRLMLASLGDEGDDRAMQSEAGLKAIERKLSKAHAKVDKHDTRYTNLFLAYFHLRDKADEGEQD